MPKKGGSRVERKLSSLDLESKKEAIDVKSNVCISLNLKSVSASVCVFHIPSFLSSEVKTLGIDKRFTFPQDS
jgi:hypothetical protein